MNISIDELNGDCECIYSDDFNKSNDIENILENNVSTYHNHDANIQNGDSSQNPEELDPKTMEFEKLFQLMHPEFVSDYLSRILKFLKSEDYKISFPNIAPFKEAFLKKLVRNLEYKGFNDVCKCIASEILDVLDVNKDVYKWVYAYDHGRFAKNVPGYRKVFHKPIQNVHKAKKPCTTMSKSQMSISPKSGTSSIEEMSITSTDKSHSTQKKNSTEDILSMTESTDISESPDFNKNKRITKSQRKLLNRKEFHPDFVVTSLNTILSLVEDEMRASWIFNDVTQEEARFYKSISTLAISRDMRRRVPKQCNSLLSNLKRKLKKASKCWVIRVEEDIVDKRNKLRDVTLTKVPIGESNSPDNQSNNKHKNEEVTIDLTMNPQHKFVKELSISSVSDDSIDMSEAPESVISGESNRNRSIESRLSRDRSISIDRRSQRSRNGIHFQSAGRLDSTEDVNSVAFKIPANRVPGRERTRSKEPELPARKSRLLEAMSVPLECDKAMRMMRLMGWQGGALGARGEGITEPIMPTLHIVTGAGLGHSAPVRKISKQSNRKPVEYRIELLENILELLCSDACEREVQYAEPLSAKEEKFMNLSLKCFNVRRNVGLNDIVEKKLVKRINEEILRKPDLTLKNSISEDRKLLLLRKIIYPQVLPQKKNTKKVTSKENNKVQVYEQPDPLLKSELLTSEEILSITGKTDLPKGIFTNKSKKSFAYRIAFLNKILEFLKNSDMEHEYRFDTVLSRKHCRYIENILTCLNLREKPLKVNCVESDILNEIKANIKGCYLNVIFSSGYQKFTLQKIFYKKRFINTSQDKATTITKIGNDKASVTNDNNNLTSHNSNSIDNTIDDLNDTDDILFVESDSDIATYEILESTHEEIVAIRNGEMCEVAINKETDYEKNQSKDVDLSNIAIRNNEECVATNKKDISSSESDVFNGDMNKLEKTILEINLDVRNDVNIKLDLNFSNDNIKFDNDNDSEQNNNNFHSDNGSQQNKELGNQKNDLKGRDKSISDIVNTNLSDKDSLLELDLKDDSDVTPDSTKRSRTDSENSDKQIKKYKFNVCKIKYVCLVPENYENEKITIETVKKIQTLILNTIDNLKFLPLLECHGVQNGALVYSCHNLETLNWLESIIVATDENLKIIPCNNEFTEKTEGTHKVAMKINSFVIECIDNLFKRIELYNPSLNTKQWVVMDVKTYDNFFVVIVIIDAESLRFITESNFSLFTGLDKAKFSIIWD